LWGELIACPFSFIPVAGTPLRALKCPRLRRALSILLATLAFSASV